MRMVWLLRMFVRNLGPTAIASAFLLLSLVATPASATTPQRTITVKFDYDFTKSPACSPTLKDKCVLQFNVYDVSVGRRIKLFSIPLPADHTGLVKGIVAKSPPLRFAPGKHVIVVTAQSTGGAESNAEACKVTIKVKR